MLSKFAGNPSPDMCEGSLRERYAQRGTAHALTGTQERLAARHDPLPIATPGL